jgi:hypothetical protein
VTPSGRFWRRRRHYTQPPNRAKKVREVQSLGSQLPNLGVCGVAEQKSGLRTIVRKENLFFAFSLFGNEQKYQCFSLQKRDNDNDRFLFPTYLTLM